MRRLAPKGEDERERRSYPEQLHGTERYGLVPDPAKTPQGSAEACERTASPSLARRRRAAEIGRGGTRRAPSSTARSSALASSGRPRPCRSMSATERSIAAGFAIPWPAICGAEPCTGSNSPGPSSPSEADAARPRPAGDRRGDVGEDVAEGVLGHDDVDRLAVRHDRHRERVDEGVVERDVGILGAAELGDDVAPEPRGVEDVHLVDGGQPAAALARDREGAAARSARPPGACTRRCRTTCRRRACPSRRSRGRRRARGRSRGRFPRRGRAEGSRRRRAPCAGPEGPAPVARPALRARAGRPRRGARRRPRGTPRASRRGAACPCARIALPPNACSACSIPSASSTRIASAATSGPIPSPGRTATRVTRGRAHVLVGAAIASSCCSVGRSRRGRSGSGDASSRRTSNGDLAAVGRDDHAAARGRRSSPSRVEVDALHQPLDLVGGKDDREHPVLPGVRAEDVSERRGDDRVEAVVLQRPGGVLAGGAAAEVPCRRAGSTRRGTPAG